MRSLATTSCGTERWSVKTMTDDDRGQVHLHAKSVSIRFLRHRDEPSYKPQTSRASRVELHTYQVRATLREYVREDDGDYHLVLKDGHGRSIIAEIPDPPCVGHISPVKPNIRAARRHFESHYEATTGFKFTHRRVIIKGVGFFDYYHGQTGMAPNDRGASSGHRPALRLTRPASGRVCANRAPDQRPGRREPGMQRQGRKLGRRHPANRECLCVGWLRRARLIEPTEHRRVRPAAVVVEVGAKGQF